MICAQKMGGERKTKTKNCQCHPGWGNPRHISIGHVLNK